MTQQQMILGNTSKNMERYDDIFFILTYVIFSIICYKFKCLFKYRAKMLRYDDIFFILTNVIFFIICYKFKCLFKYRAKMLEVIKSPILLLMPIMGFFLQREMLWGYGDFYPFLCFFGLARKGANVTNL